MARTPTRAAPTRAPTRAPAAAPTRAAPTPMPATVPTQGTPLAQLSPNQQRMAAAGSNFLAASRAAPAAGPDDGFMQAMQAARAASAQTPARAVAQPQTQPLPPSAGRLTPAQMPASARQTQPLPPTPARGLGAVQQAANQQRMAAKTGAPLPSGMSPGGGQPTPPSRTGGGMPTMAGGPGGMKKGGKVKKMAKGGSVSSASKRGDGCAIKGKTRGKLV